MDYSDWEDASFAGRGRLFDALIAAAILGLAASLAASIVSDLCFHNIAGTEVAAPGSDRGHWCDALASGSSWELRDIGAVVVFGAAVAVIPGPRPIRAILWVVAFIAILAVPVYMSALSDSITI